MCDIFLLIRYAHNLGDFFIASNNDDWLFFHIKKFLLYFNYDIIRVFKIGSYFIFLTFCFCILNSYSIIWDFLGGCKIFSSSERVYITIQISYSIEKSLVYFFTIMSDLRNYVGLSILFRDLMCELMKFVVFNIWFLIMIFYISIFLKRKVYG